MNDKEILCLLIEEPVAGLRAAIKTYHGGVQGMIRRILIGRPEDVEECVADTFTRLWEMTQQSRVDSERDSVKGLVFTIGRNLAITRYRKLKKRIYSPWMKLMRHRERILFCC